MYTMAAPPHLHPSYFPPQLPQRPQEAPGTLGRAHGPDGRGAETREASAAAGGAYPIHTTSDVPSGGFFSNKEPQIHAVAATLN